MERIERLAGGPLRHFMNISLLLSPLLSAPHGLHGLALYNSEATDVLSSMCYVAPVGVSRRSRLLLL
jgi:hypothetical protein